MATTLGLRPTTKTRSTTPMQPPQPSRTSAEVRQMLTSSTRFLPAPGLRSSASVGSWQASAGSSTYDADPKHKLPIEPRFFHGESFFLTTPPQVFLSHEALR